VTKRFHRLELDTQPQRSENTPVLASGTNMQLQGDLHDSAYWMRLAIQNRRNGEFEEALRHYSRAVELDRSVVAGWVGQVQILIALTEFPEAELWARKALELFRNHAELLAARAQALCRNGDLQQAQAVSDSAIAQPGQSEYCWIARGDLMLARKDHIEQHCFDKAVQLNSDWPALIEIAAIYSFYKRYAKALERCRQAVEKAPDQPHCWYQQGCYQRAIGMTNPAMVSFKQCLDLNPKHH
jgi:tetratricopeptide (TPR) repeat protein